MPITDSGFFRSPNFSTASWGMIASAIGFETMSRNQTYGSFSVNLTVYLSTTSTLSSAAIIARLALPFSETKRSKVYLTSSAVSSRPFTGGLLCQRTPFLSLKM